ncbi:MAG: class I SAM-dependent methyltransferase [Gemmatimonadetes bacterium]|jgi:predicted O-methyltransferase YrrM|nr:class I SAM-dependent methyltransferase [Gemmatimonadota bacterium]
MVRALIRKAGKRAIDLGIVRPSRRFARVGRAIRDVSGHVAAVSRLVDSERTFLANGRASRYDKATRASIVERFRRIDQGIDIKTTPTDGLFLAEALLSVESAGAIVECGCYNGGSTAKLSILAELTGRHLFVFDSFEGLPDVDDYNRYDLHARRSLRWVRARSWTAGQYAAPLDVVKANVEKYGVLSRCTFVKGWFSETLHERLPPQIAFAFTDVDLPSSARECLLHIWPRLSERGAFFSHDIAYIKVLQEFNDEHLWKDVFRDHPPIFFGAGYGMGDSSPHLGFAVKGRVTAEYMKSLTFDKRS